MSLTKATLQGMIDEEYDAMFNKYKRLQGSTFATGKSHSDMTWDVQTQMYDQLSDPLKKMYAGYLNDVVRNCYKEKHMDESFTN